ncbi:MAG TPA: hypothetical protein PKD32_12900 [Saprospiraceae bacterium]|nr:hypothetical protein [Saprospiraceae bacterium]
MRKYIIGGLIIFFSIGYLIHIQNQINLSKRVKFSNATITFVGKGVKEDEFTVRYIFNYDNVDYIEQNGYGIYDIDKKCLASRMFQVAFDSLDPSNSQIIITREDYSRYKIPFPDSFPCVFQF